MSRTLYEKAEIVARWFQDNVFDRSACLPQLTDCPIDPPPLLAASSSSCPSPLSLRVLSFNTWGLPIAPRCSQRIRHLSTLFPEYDLLCLQEMSHNRDVAALVALASQHGLHYHHQFRQGVGFPVWNGITAPGLLVLSRCPIVDVAIRRFPVNGLLQRFDHSDWVAAKGAGLVRLDVSSLLQQTAGAGRGGPELAPSPVLVDVFVTHLHANYSNYYYNYSLCYSSPSTARIPSPPSCPDLYLAHRICQAFELARFVSSHRDSRHLCIVCGDLNAPPYDLVLHLLQLMAGLHDAYAEKGGGSAGYTCGAHDNGFSKYAEAVSRGEDEAAVRRRHGWEKAADRPAAGLQGRDELHETPKRIDYILYSPPAASPPLTLSSCRVVKPVMRIDSRPYSLSDHHAVAATFALTQQPAGAHSNGHHAAAARTANSDSSSKSPSSLAAPPPLALELSPPPSPAAPERSISTSASTSSSPAAAFSSALSSSLSSSPLPPLSSSPLPPLSSVLTVAVAIVTAGVKQTQARRASHWLLSARCAVLFLFLSGTSALSPTSRFALSLQSALQSLLLSAALAEWAVWLLLTAGAVVRALSVWVSVLTFLVSQFPSKEEEMALLETLQEMRVQLQSAVRTERERGALSSHNKEYAS